jgi:hypothetical protein
MYILCLTYSLFFPITLMIALNQKLGYSMDIA